LKICEDESGWFPLDLAAENDHFSVIRYLIEDSGQPVDATADNNYALQSAAANIHLPIVRYLLEESDQHIDATSNLSTTGCSESSERPVVFSTRASGSVTHAC
jgi:ankyrin repeat protein